MTLLNWFINRDSFPTDPIKVPEVSDGELTLPLIDESRPPIVQK